MNLSSFFEHQLTTFVAKAQHKPQIVLALSGGMDSRVLLDLLKTYAKHNPHYDYLVIHIHHGLSPNADDWLAACKRWTKEAGFNFKGIKVLLKTEGESLENAARKARYEAISQEVKEGAFILTGQHAEDQCETFLLALKRGSGPKGLAAMPVFRPLAKAFLFRPLLTVSRLTISEYAKEKKLDWLNDESNFDTRFDRNFIRQTWLPIASARWSGLVPAINRSAKLCAEQEALIDELLTPYDDKLIQIDGSFCLTEYLKLSEKMQSAMLRRWLTKMMLTSVSFAKLYQIQVNLIGAAEDANPILNLGDWQIRRFRQKLYVIRAFLDVSHWQAKLIPDVPLVLPDKLGLIGLYQTPHKNALGLKQPTNKVLIRVSFDPKGLSAHPLGRQGKRKLKKLFQEYGVPSWQRQRMPLIFYDETLVAVAGLFVCEGFLGTDFYLDWTACAIPEKSAVPEDEINTLLPSAIKNEEQIVKSSN